MFGELLLEGGVSRGVKSSNTFWICSVPSVRQVLYTPMCDQPFGIVSNLLYLVMITNHDLFFILVLGRSFRNAVMFCLLF